MYLRPMCLAFLLAALSAGVLGLDILPVTKDSQPDKDVDMPSVTLDLLNKAHYEAEDHFKKRVQLEDALPPTGLVQATSKSVEARHQRFLAFKQKTADLDYNASFYDTGSTFLKNQLKLTNDQATFGLKKVSFPEGSKWKDTNKQCKDLFKTSKCDAKSKFRTNDGSCNNLEHPAMGRSHTCMTRLLPPVFDDGISKPRKSKSNKELPNVRNISLLIHEALVTPNATFTHMVMQFGQFITHDVTMGLMTRTVGNHTMISCCPLGENQHTECGLRIEILKNPKDFFSQKDQTCMNFVRSALCSPNCGLGPREHSNQITSFADASNIYGSDSENEHDLRNFTDGLLNSQNRSSDDEYLPYNSYPTTDQCSRPEENRRCFLAGDKRVNENPGLTSLHNIFLRQHNRLARIFKGMHPEMNDEQLYQLTRRIVVAQYQNIVFKEFLPVLLGKDYMEFFQLNTNSPTDYMPNLDPSILNEFMTSANRYGHLLIQNTLERGPGSQSAMNLDEVYLSPFILMEGEFEPILKGLADQPGKEFEGHLVTAVTHTLYRQKEVLFGMDLAALNIQRGRDQGTAGYTKYIKHCFNKDITKFEDLDEFMSKEYRMKLQSIYESVEDIDLFTGGASEDKMTGAVVGPTYGCILGIQFYRLKFGDRFYFEHRNQAGSFKENELKEILKTTFAHIICANTKNVAKIAPNVFLTGSKTNVLTDCKNIPAFDHTIF